MRLAVQFARLVYAMPIVFLESIRLGLFQSRNGNQRMSKVHAYACEICGRQKGKANHWWIAVTTGQSLTLRAWDDALAEHPEMKHLCGDAHRDTFIERWSASQRDTA